MKLTQGTCPYPTNVDPDAVRTFARKVRAVAEGLEQIDDTVDRAALTARQHWVGDAADTFGHHMNDRGHAFELGAARAREAASALEQLAAAIDRSQRAYANAVDAEDRAAARQSDAERAEAIGQQGTAVGIAVAAGARCDSTLATMAGLLDGYTARSFRPVGEDTTCRWVDPSLSGRDLIVDSLLATEDSRIATDEIQIRKLDDGTYIVVLPGVTDLTSNLTSPWKWVTGGPQDTVRKVANAQPSVIWNGQNSYADAVKIALQRAGVPSGAVVTFVGHSYGSYTAVDLAKDDDFNSIDGTSKGYNLRVKNVYGFGADVDWKLRQVPKETNVVALNSRDDQVYQVETRFHPETGEVVRRKLFPFIDLLPAPTYRPTTEYPSDRTNQVEVRINAGRGIDTEDFYSGHHPKNYAGAVPNVSREINDLYARVGNGRVVEVKNVRVPDGPRDTVPSTAR